MAAAVSFLLATSRASSDSAVTLKVGSILLLAFLGFGVDKLLGCALAISALGDFLLGVPNLGSLTGEKLFLFGLGSFLLAHLVYIAMFRRYHAHESRKLSPAQLAGIAAILIVLTSMLAMLWNSLGPLLIPVVVYALVLCTMGVSAMLADLGNSLAAIGALSFIASDAMLAISKFRAPFASHEPLIWLTYYAAQLLIFLGVSNRRRFAAVRP
jgi:uncharacterized membrane protein YhhN